MTCLCHNSQNAGRDSRCGAESMRIMETWLAACKDTRMLGTKQSSSASAVLLRIRYYSLLSRDPQCCIARRQPYISEKRGAVQSES